MVYIFFFTAHSGDVSSLSVISGRYIRTNRRSKETKKAGHKIQISTNAGCIFTTVVSASAAHNPRERFFPVLHAVTLGHFHEN